MAKKIKYKSAAHKKAALEAEKYQQEMFKRWGINPNAKSKSNKSFSGNYSHRSSDDVINRATNSAGVCAKKDSPKYTGDLVVGIAVQHKSCLQPVISKQQAIESATMRRG